MEKFNFWLFKSFGHPHAHANIFSLLSVHVKGRTRATSKNVFFARSSCTNRLLYNNNEISNINEFIYAFELPRVHSSCPTPIPINIQSFGLSLTFAHTNTNEYGKKRREKMSEQKNLKTRNSYNPFFVLRFLVARNDLRRHSNKTIHLYDHIARKYAHKSNESTDTENKILSDRANGAAIAATREEEETQKISCNAI